MPNLAYKVDVVTMNDIYSDKDRRGKRTTEGFQYGYTRKELKKLKVEFDGFKWGVRFPGNPGKLVRDKNGYWTTDKQLRAEAEGG